MNKISKSIIYILLAIFTGLMVWVLVLRKDSGIFQSVNCFRGRYILNLRFKGILIKKYSDLKNHNLETLLIKNDGHAIEIPLVYNRDSVLWTNTMINDSVIKEINSTQFILKHLDKIDTVEIDYPCQ